MWMGTESCLLLNSACALAPFMQTMNTILGSSKFYSIGWIAALPIERAAATAVLDDRHDTPEGFHRHESDTNSYTWGKIGQHNIAIASIPAGTTGVTSAAAVISKFRSSLPHIENCLSVGIGSGVPRLDLNRDIRLGDVVVGQPDGTEGGVIQYDRGKKKYQTSERTGSLNNPSLALLSALGSLQAEHEIEASKIPDFLEAMWEANPQMRRPKNNLPGFIHQGFVNDRLFESSKEHVGTTTCQECSPEWEIQRIPRETTDPKIHYGLIASGNWIINDAIIRDKLAEDIGEACMCFETEAAGMNQLPYLVIRGICDYADSHKNDQWQRYASATAAAYAKELLSFVRVSANGPAEATTSDQTPPPTTIKAILKLDSLSNKLIAEAKTGSETAVQKLLEDDIYPDITDMTGLTPLYWAALHGHDAVVRLLLQKGANQASPHPGQPTPFWGAVYNGHDKVVRLLLEEGFKQHPETSDESVAFFWAVFNGDVERVRPLLKEGVNADGRDLWDVTPLFWATHKGHYKVAKLLLDSKVNRDPRNMDNRTPLWLAAHNGDEDMVKLLLEKGAKPSSTDRWGDPPSAWAERHGHDEVVNLLNLASKGSTFKIKLKGWRWYKKLRSSRWH